jgi:hypothetical protein
MRPALCFADIQIFDTASLAPNNDHYNNNNPNDYAFPVRRLGVYHQTVSLESKMIPVVAAKPTAVRVGSLLFISQAFLAGRLLSGLLHTMGLLSGQLFSCHSRVWRTLGYKQGIKGIDADPGRRVDCNVIPTMVKGVCEQ